MSSWKSLRIFWAISSESVLQVEPSLVEVLMVEESVPEVIMKKGA